MSDIIKLLPDAIANQIAAGEVVQRPASVVKELLENALDAGATHIKLVVKDGGKTLVQVTDNGCGMSETDARMCFERHATSKITTANDLFALRTFGFRGEAMASIAAVAHVSLRTRQAQHDTGTEIVIEGSTVVRHQRCQTAIGTNIAVKNLFYNVPARRQFLKADPVENRHIIDEFQHVALANPDVHFTLHNNDTELYHLPAAPLRRRIVGIFGNTYNDKLIPVEESSIDFLKINGFVGKPDAVRKTRGEQFFFVNDRFIRSTYLHHAVASAFDQLIPAKTYPFYVLFLDIDPARIDVNVHPTKQEIKFDDEQSVYSLLNAAVKRALSKNSITPSLDFDQNPLISAAFNQQQQTPLLPTHQSPQNQPPNKQTPTHQRPPTHQADHTQHWRDIYAIMQEQTAHIQLPTDTELDTTPPLPQTITLPSHINQQQQPIWQQTANSASPTDTPAAADLLPTAPQQLHRQYVVAQIQSGCMLIDQQAAHQRILYEHYLQQLSQRAAMVQQLLFPTTISLPAADAALLTELLPDLQALGYDLHPQPPHQFVLRGVPANTADTAHHQQQLEELLEQYQLLHTTQQPTTQQQRLARSMAYHHSIKKGTALATAEMEALIDRLFACQTPYIAPNGKPTFVTFTLDDMAAWFGNA